MNVLENEPFNLQEGDIISNRVTISAVNSAGSSQKSDFNLDQDQVSMLTTLPQSSTDSPPSIFDTSATVTKL